MALPATQFPHLYRSSREDLSRFKSPIQPSRSDPSTPIAPVAARTHIRPHTSPARLDKIEKFYREDSFIPHDEPSVLSVAASQSDLPTETVKINHLLIAPSAVKIKYAPNSDVAKVEEDIFKCFNAYPGHQGKKLAVLLQIQSLFEPGKMNEFLKLMLLRAPYAALIKAYFARVQKDFNAFAAESIPQLLNTQQALTLIHLCGLYTLLDLEGEKPSTLFRQTCFSSTLCKEVGRGFWARELAQLNGSILGALKKNDMWKNDPFLLCLDRTRTRDVLEEQLKRISVGNQDHYVETMLMDHAVHFLKFAREVLPTIYSMEMPGPLCTLVKERRAHIMDFLKKNSAKDPKEESRPYIGELVCNRILCPYIISLDRTAEVLCVMISLTKFIQNCASGVRFGGDKGDPVYEKLNPLFDEFGPMYCKFIDAHSL